MSYRLSTLVLSSLVIIWGSTALAEGEIHIEDSVSDEEVEPDWCGSVHSVGRLVMPVNNSATFGSSSGNIDCFTGEILGSFCEYPKGSSKKYLYGGGLQVGGIIGVDTIINRCYPAAAPNGKMIRRSTVDPTKPWYEGALSHYDLLAKCYDTVIDTNYLGEVHYPMNIEVTCNSYSWANDYGQDLILFDYEVKNIGTDWLRHVYCGVYVDGDIFLVDQLYTGPTSGDDKTGFIEKDPAIWLPENCPRDSVTLNLGWTADDDGNRLETYPNADVKDITGLCFLSLPDPEARVSYNWWTWEFGPQLRANYRQSLVDNPYYPTEADTYHLLSNGERDYDQVMFPTIPMYDTTWVQPKGEVWQTVKQGGDCRFQMSFGPYGLFPGQSIKFTTAYVAGLAFHRHRHIHEFLPDDPFGWYRRVFFDNLVKNSVWADWIYDNPGVDTDSDGYAGKYVLCDLDEDSLLLCDTLVDTSANPDTNYVRCRWVYNVADTMWIKGDGIPDFRGAAPPPNPNTHMFVNKYGDTLPGLRVYPEVGRVRMVWNGAVTENTPDWFSHKYDFEGYRVYIALDNRPSSFSLVDSYDKENYNQWEYDYTAHKFRCPNRPFTLQELRCMHGDSCSDTVWSPFWYTRTNPLVYPGGPKKNDRVIFFEECGYNRSILANDPTNANTHIKKVYPHAVRPPHVHPDSLAIYYPDRGDTTYFDSLGYLKYYEYEYTFEGLLPTIPYYVNVTAFDYGYPELGLDGLEGDPAHVPKAMYPLPSSDYIKEKNLGVFVFPNPYRIDADYRARDYEARLRWHVPEDKTRLIHFANLPHKCTISIFSLDGDLIRELKHDVDPDNYLANHETWDLINRNFQLVVTGLYYWVVEDDRGESQIGKLVIIM